MKIIVYLILSLLLSNIAIAETTSNTFTLPQNNYVILPIKIAPQILKQCSRDTPQADSFWVPEKVQIIQLEEQIIDFINLRKKNSFSTPTFQAYDRQYIGIIQNGKKLIYGNYFPSQASQKKIFDMSRVFQVCDGFGHFWGIVYNPATQQFSELEVNGIKRRDPD